MSVKQQLRTIASPALSAKAWVAAVVSFLAPIGALLAGSEVITWRTFAAAGVAGIVGGVSVYATGNALPATGRHALARKGATIMPDGTGTTDEVVVQLTRADGTTITSTPDTVEVRRADGTVVTGTSKEN